MIIIIISNIPTFNQMCLIMEDIASFAVKLPIITIQGNFEIEFYLETILFLVRSVFHVVSTGIVNISYSVYW